VIAGARAVVLPVLSEAAGTAAIEAMPAARRRRLAVGAPPELVAAAGISSNRAMQHPRPRITAAWATALSTSDRDGERPGGRFSPDMGDVARGRASRRGRTTPTT
jgi:hypothetical protein